MYSTILSGAVQGVDACMVQVEVDVAKGLPSFSMVGSLCGEVRESKERVWAALKNVGLTIPPMRITVNLSPADLRKEGTAFDLPIAIGLLEALAYFPEENAKGVLFLGELGLNGEVRKVQGVLPIVRAAQKAGINVCFIPEENAGEGGLIPQMQVHGIRHISEAILLLQAQREEWESLNPCVSVDVEGLFLKTNEENRPDFSQVSGQHMAKRAALIAAAGFHNLLMTGPPGAGKSMIAKRIPEILPPLTVEEGLEVTSIYSVAGKLGMDSLITKRPFQSPHHTVSCAALVGGGMVPKPGLLSLSHRGVLFLDELTEFSKKALESMRQPIEDRKIQLVRVNGNIEYPADFMLVCAMNPCPCGFYPDRNKCRCSEPEIRRYLTKISGPILDRIDLCVELQPVDITTFHEKDEGMAAEQMRKKVEKARKMQTERYQNTCYRFNADVEVADMDRFCYLGEDEKKCMETLYREIQFSARSYHRIRRVARTIADLEESEQIRTEHLLEAAMFRPNKDYWK